MPKILRARLPRDVRVERPGEKASLVDVRLRREQQCARDARNRGDLRTPRIKNQYIEDNHNAGLMCEISYNAVIEYDAFSRNG